MKEVVISRCLFYAPHRNTGLLMKTYNPINGIDNTFQIGTKILMIYSTSASFYEQSSRFAALPFARENSGTCQFYGLSFQGLEVSIRSKVLSVKF